MRLGYIDYLNCYPFYFHMFHRRPVEAVQIFPGYPSDLNSMMLSGKLDMSPVSAATCAELQDRFVFLPDFCLSSVGYVGSVVLRSKVPIEDLEGKLVGITSASRTSVLLLQILLRRYYGVIPRYLITSPNPPLKDLDAALLIGNEAMIPSHDPVPFSYDLGELWLRKTGYPVVFAVFAVRESSLLDCRHHVGAVVDSFCNSLRSLQAERKTVITGAQQRYPNIPYDIDAYYRLLQFEFTDELKNALRFYLDTAADLGLLRKIDQIRYLEPARMSAASGNLA